MKPVLLFLVSLLFPTLVRAQGDSIQAEFTSFTYESYDASYGVEPLWYVDLYNVRWTATIPYPKDAIENLYLNIWDSTSPVPIRIQQIKDFKGRDSTSVDFEIGLAGLDEYLFFSISPKGFKKGDAPLHTCAIRYADYVYGSLKELLSGISSPTATPPSPTSSSSDGLYDLSGRRLSARPTKGLYIEDGKVRVGMKK